MGENGGKPVEGKGNEEKMKNLYEAAYKYVKKFTWEKATDEFENILKTCHKKVIGHEDTIYKG